MKSQDFSLMYLCSLSILIGALTDLFLSSVFSEWNNLFTGPYLFVRVFIDFFMGILLYSIGGLIMTVNMRNWIYTFDIYGLLVYLAGCALVGIVIDFALTYNIFAYSSFGISKICYCDRLHGLFSDLPFFCF